MEEKIGTKGANFKRKLKKNNLCTDNHNCNFNTLIGVENGKNRC